jgi:hypothetical protein
MLDNDCETTGLRALLTIPRGVDEEVMDDVVGGPDTERSGGREGSRRGDVVPTGGEADSSTAEDSDPEDDVGLKAAKSTASPAGFAGAFDEDAIVERRVYVVVMKKKFDD